MKKCPAYGRKCLQCGKRNHFKPVRCDNPVNLVDENQSDETDYGSSYQYEESGDEDSFKTETIGSVAR